MSKLDDLINKLCPGGVEFKELYTIAEIGTGSSDRKDSVEDGLYPFYVRSKEVLRINSYEYDEDAIVIPGEGGIGEIFHFVSGKYALHQRAYRIHILDKNISTRFVYYYMFSNFKSFIMQKAVSATVTSIRKPMIEKFEIPVPPLEVQNEIVRILDKFTSLEAELEEALGVELEARRKQYEYYRDSLLTFGDDVEWKSIGELFDFKNGLNKDKSAFGYGIPFVKYTDVYNNKKIIKELLTGKVQLNEKEIESFGVHKGDVLFTRCSETKEEVGFASAVTEDLGDCAFNGFVLRARPKTNLLLPDYCAYCFRTYYVRKEIIRTCSFTTRANTTGVILSKIKIPVPSLEKQKQIATILDRFESLCNDINSGLPAEIEARHKQYEYYRDKLLTFKRKEA